MVLWVKLRRLLIAATGAVAVAGLIAGCATPQLASPIQLLSAQKARTVVTPSVERNGACADESLQLTQPQLYIDSTRRWSLIAELTNNTSDHVASTVVCVTVTNPGSPIPLYEEWYIGTTVHGYETVPFRLLLDATDIHPDAHVSVFAQRDLRQRMSDLPVDADTRNFSIGYVKMNGAPPGHLSMTGQIGNTGDSAANNVRVVFALYGDDGRLVGVADAQAVGLEPLSVGQTVEFTATTNLALSHVARYRWIAEGELAQDGE